MKKLLPLLCACLALAPIGAGCGSDEKKNSDSNGGGGAAAPAKTTSGGGGGAGKTAEVNLKNIQFNPASVTIAKGGTVTWTNEDSVGHDVTAKDGSFKSGSAGGLKQSDTFSHKFTKAGDFKYVCTVHPGMEGDVAVK